MRRYLVFLPSLALGLISMLFLAFRPLRLQPQTDILQSLLLGLAVGLVLLAASWLLERFLASYRFASQLLEAVLISTPITPLTALLLALASALSEEFFFRGVLLSIPWLGLWGQAVLFGFMHPVPRSGWSYMLFAFIVALLFGQLTLMTGRLIPAIAAHFLVNFCGFLTIYQMQRRKRQHRHRIVG